MAKCLETAYLGMVRDLIGVRAFTLKIALQKREDHVILHRAFSEWVSKESFGYIPEVKDLDHISTQKRQVSFETYIEMISRMDLREQILAKLFYLGGTRALEEVISLRIEELLLLNPLLISQKASPILIIYLEI